ncbi:hypothetical protein M406DRAFT_229188, partial [Cryphonectria parasitica EP155]
LLDEKSPSEIDSEAGRADNDTRFPSGQEWALFSRRVVRGLAVPTRMPSKSCCRAFAIRTFLFLLPSFVASRLSPGGAAAQTGRLSATAYLDGMRGLAAFIVFFCHYSYSSFAIADGWGSHEENYDLFKLPFLRLVWAGPPMVAIFFIISGYALSLKPLKLARSRRWADFSTAMTSFVFRRAFRLFLPTILSTLMVVALLRVGAYEWNREWSHDRAYHWNVQETAPELMETTEAQLRDWGWHMFDFVHIWTWDKYGGSTYYDVHLWTIPVEFRASMMLFLTLLGLARLRTGLRLVFLAVIMAFCYRSDRWEMVLFYVGMLYAELDIIRGAHSDPATTAALPTMHSEPRPLMDYLRRLAWALLATTSLYLLSQPDVNSENTPGWVYLSALIPEWVDDKYRYWQCIGAALFVFCTARMPTLQRVFNTTPVQYLGRISYAIYLMHGPVLHTVGYGIERWAWGVTGTEGAAHHWGFFLGAVFIVPGVVWAADVFWRAVDAPVVRFAKWLESVCVVAEE